MKQCKIIVKDEVNVKIEGLELSERKQLMKMFEYEIPGARYLPAVRLGRWNGKVSYFSLAGSTYINLLPEILPVLDHVGYDIELEDLRDYTTTFTFDKVSEATFKHKNWPKGHPKEGQPVELRDYQIEIVNNFLENPQSLQEIATGAGVPTFLFPSRDKWSQQSGGIQLKDVKEYKQILATMKQGK